MRRFKKIIVDKVEYKWLFRLVLQKKCGRNTEEIQKKFLSLKVLYHIRKDKYIQILLERMKRKD